jgi:hypothetical protein
MCKNFGEAIVTLCCHLPMDLTKIAKKDQQDVRHKLYRCVKLLCALQRAGGGAVVEEREESED